MGPGRGGQVQKRLSGLGNSKVTLGMYACVRAAEVVQSLFGPRGGGDASWLERQDWRRLLGFWDSRAFLGVDVGAGLAV